MIRRVLAFSLTAALAFGALGGCGGGVGGGARTGGAERTIDAGVAVSDDAFAGAVRDFLLSDPASKERAQRLAGVEARQMVRASSRFKAHVPDRGIAAVTGGLYLVRTRELKPGILGPAGKDALTAAVRDLASHGDEGRARALYEILVKVSSDADKKDIQTHLDAINAWTKDTLAIGGPLQSAGALEQVAVARRLLEPSDAALEEADSRTIAWIERAITLRNQYREQHRPPPREEATEAFRALQSGARTLAAIHLRDGDAAGALRAIDKAQARELARDDLLHALESVADKPDASRWLDVLHAMRPQSREEGRDEEDLDDKEMLRAAAWNVAMEAYRLDPSLPEAAGAVAAGLQEYGMTEASPAVLVHAVKAHPDARTVGGALAIAMHGMAQEVEAQDSDAARRTYKAAAPLLQMADDPKLAGKVQPSAAHVRAMMGEIELRDGRVKEARELLTSASDAEKAGSVLATLARIERFDNQIPAAIGHLKEALNTPDVQKDAALRGEILLTLSDIAREQGDMTGARGPLTDALKLLAVARTKGEPEDRARIERVLSRVLDRFGATQQAHKALERAYDDAPRDKQQVSATLGMMVARALVRNDLPAARDALRRAMAADLEDEDVVYVALWVRLLEKQMKTPTDGAPERVFSSILDDGRWIGRLAAWGAGRIKAEELVASAKTPAQKTEALFYAGMEKRAAGDMKGAEATLKQALGTGGIDLMEVALARDILSGPRAQIGGAVPEVGLP